MIVVGSPVGAAQAIEHWTTASHWVPKELYFTYHLKLRQAVFALEDKSLEEGMEIAKVCVAFECMLMHAYALSVAGGLGNRHQAETA